MTAALQLRPPRAPGHRVGGRFILRERLGRGATATVWRAWDELEAREVALKVLTGGADVDEPTRRRFLREVLAAQAVPHPAVIQVYAAGADPVEGAWIATKLYRGPTLAERLTERTGAWSVDEVAAVALPLLDGLAAAHERGVLHRDLKPENVVLHEEDDALRPVLLDFGGAKVLTLNDPLTLTGSVFGTPLYLSPEQARDTRAVDARTDVWAFGVLLYRLLVGVVPFDAPNLAALIAKVNHALPRSPASMGVAPAVSSVVLRCLEKDPDARYPDARALQRDLCAALGLAPDAGAPGGAEITAARVVPAAEAAATIRPIAFAASLVSIPAANDTRPTIPSDSALLMPPAPPRGSVPPEYFGVRVTPLRAPPPDLVRAARRMERHQRASRARLQVVETQDPALPPLLLLRPGARHVVGLIAAVAAALLSAYGLVQALG
ncbi:MAG: serine/threonine-protein kinase [Polyangiales bacterium]